MTQLLRSKEKAFSILTGLTASIFLGVSLGCATFLNHPSQNNQSSRNAASTALATARPSPRALIVFSVDGVGYDQLQKIDPDFVVQQSVSAIKPSTPSLTFTGHATLATGVEPSVHGITGNHDRKVADLKAKPVWTEAAERGLQVRTNAWPFSQGPWHGIHHHKNQKYEQYVDGLTFPKFANDALTTLLNWDRKSDLLYMAWTPGLDDPGHSYGPYADKTVAAWQSLKRQIAIFSSRLDQMGFDPQQVAVVFVGDHGMADIAKCSFPCLIKRKMGDQGFHGSNPDDLHEMYAAIWSYPHLSEGHPQKMTDFKSFIWQYFGDDSAH